MTRAMSLAAAPRADRPRRRRRAQRLPRQALHLVGPRVLRLDGREHAHDRLHRQGHRGGGRHDRRQPRDDGAAHRRRHLGLPRDHLRDPHRDGRLGALGGDDRVHVHGAALAARAPARDGRVRGRLRRRARRRCCSSWSRRSSACTCRTRTTRAALVLLLVASISFIGIGMMTAVLPLISPEKGTQLGFVAQGLLLVVSGVYYPVSVLPEWMQWLAKISPATYALRGCRAAILEGAGLSSLWGDIWPLLVIGAVSVPLGLWVFRTRRALREEAREAEAVGMIDDPAGDDRCRPRGVDPGPPRGAPERVGAARSRASRARESDERLLLLAELDGELAGQRARRSLRHRAAASAWRPACCRSSAARGRHGAPARARGPRRALRCAPRPSALVDDEGSRGVRRAVRLREVDRQVEQVRTLGGESEAPTCPTGSRSSTVAERPELLREAYPLASEGYADLATDGPVERLARGLAARGGDAARRLVRRARRRRDRRLLGPDEPRQPGRRRGRADGRAARLARRGLALALKRSSSRGPRRTASARS